MSTFDMTTLELVNPMSYQQFRILTEALSAVNRTTGMEQTEERIAFTALNQQRMKRVEKQFILIPELRELLEAQQGLNWNWLVLVESWCSDGAQVLPALAAIAAAVPGTELTVLLRDENPALMDTCLTNGSRSIPKLICLDAATGERVFTWGPRPKAIQERVKQFKADNPQADHDAFVLNLHTWYGKDRSQSVQQDMFQVLQAVLAPEGAQAEV